MSIAFQVLGAPGYDNALFVRVQTGQTIHRLLFDCGADCLDALSVAEIQAIDHLLFSHLHMDHVAGFDDFFRHTFNRLERPNCIWGPPDTARIIHHRMQGYRWNLVAHLQASWQLHDLNVDSSARWRTDANDGFATLHPEPAPTPADPLIRHHDYTVQALALRHSTPSLGYLVREAPRLNIDPERLEASGLPRGPWLEQVRRARPDEPGTIAVADSTYELAALRADLLSERPGDSIAYLTDFSLDDLELERLAGALHGVGVLVCESQYRAADADLARRNAHMTAQRAAELARRAEAGRLVLLHLSRRYTPGEWRELLAEARAIFPAAELPLEWNIA